MEFPLFRGHNICKAEGFFLAVRSIENWSSLWRRQPSHQRRSSCLRWLECGGVWDVSNKTQKTCDGLGYILRGPIQFSSDIIYESSTLPHSGTTTQNQHYYATWYTRIVGCYITLWVFQSGRVSSNRFLYTLYSSLVSTCMELFERDDLHLTQMYQVLQ